MVHLQSEGHALNSIRLHSFFLIALCATFMVGLLVRISAAQSLPRSTSDLDFRITFGFTDTVVTERWMPLRINVLGGLDVSEGVAVVTAGTGNETATRVFEPWVATPGRTTRVEIPLIVPNTSHLYDESAFFTVSIYSDRGKLLKRQQYSSSPRGSFLGMGIPLTGDSVVILDVGLRFRVDGLNVFNVTPDVLPRSAMLYDAVSALALSSEAVPYLSSAQTSALREWIDSGGTLILVVHGVNADISRVLPQGILTPIDAPDGVAGYAIAPSARESGWERVEVTPDVTGIPIPCIHGHHGFGQLLLVQRADIEAALPSNRSAVWETLLEHCSISIPSPEDQHSYYYTGSIWFDAVGIDGLASRFDIQVPLWWIPLFVLVIALALGFIDRMIMRRLGLLHRTWYTALLWLLLLGVIAYTIPHWMRAGETEAVGYEIIDVSPSGTAFRTHLVGVNAGESRLLKLAPSHESSSVWDRPVYTGNWGTPRSLSPLLALDTADGARATEFPISLWTFRSILREERTASTVSAAASTDETGRITIAISGLPDQPIRLAAFRHGDMTYEIQFERSSAGERRFIFDPEHPNPTIDWPGVSSRISHHHQNRLHHWRNPSKSLPIIASTLPGTASRSKAIERAEKSHAFSAVYIEFEERDLDSPFQDLTTSTASFYRIPVMIAPHSSSPPHIFGESAP